MIGSVLRGVAIFVAGPLIAFGVLSLGCDGASPVLGNACGHNILLALVALTLACWCVLAMAASVVSAVRSKL
jgi:hypothetical protein